MRDGAKEGTTRHLVAAPKQSVSSPRQIALCGAVSLLVVLAAACGQKKTRTEWRPEDHQPPPAEVPEGQGAAEESGDATARAAAALWSMRCAQCHGEHGHGDGSGKPPGVALPDFASAAFQDKRSDSELYQVIDKGRNMMPAFGQEITRAGIEALIGHVRSLREQK
jgi:mono/diheme cytochrome c family protein